MSEKDNFKILLKEFASTITEHLSSGDGQWTVKGFIDIYKNVYTISSDTKIVSKILEIHLFPKILTFAEQIGYKIVLADHQNYYPDLTFIKKSDEKIKFAVDFKTTYRKPENKNLCNGFTLGSHGEYFINRENKKNIQFPYGEYNGHFCFGIIYDRADGSTIDETKVYKVDNLQSIVSVVKNFQFFVVEKWKIASDRGGSGNTANIGSIVYIKDIIEENGMFSRLGEKWFDDYWINYNKITIINDAGKPEKINNLYKFVKYRGGDVSLIIQKHNGVKK